ncbi:MAG: excinuclease ABC subunit UvrC, partial [Sedimentisphaerales bacterium]|nr:excinuclease ABC subunit UvrC [Sedimentisphaerales bacterium]
MSDIKAIREKIQGFPSGPGLYFMKGAKEEVLYIGKAKNLRSRVSSYFQPSADVVETRGPKIAEMLNKVETVDFLETETEVDAMLKEARLIKDIRPPYNTDLIDDKTFPYLEITMGDDFPGVYITRTPRASGSRLFGPFASAKDLRAVFVELQKIFKFRSCNLDIRADDKKRRFFRPCLLYSINQCVGPCGAKIERQEYKVIIKDLIKFLQSKRSTVLRQLKKQMGEASAAREYEKAGVLRDRIRLIEKLDERGEPDEDVQPEVFAAEPTEALVRMQKILNTPNSIRIIEGIDIANIGGKEAVGSLVKFIDGRPFKAGYRRFKIRTVEGSDDYAMIAEVVKRRYKYALRGEELWPDLILIDGGLGQLHAAESALKELFTAEHAESAEKQIINLKLAAIAKREDEIYLQGTKKPLRLPRQSPVLKLLQYVRDEAHRFAQHYHHILRSKKVLGENYNKRRPKSGNHQN